MAQNEYAAGHAATLPVPTGSASGDPVLVGASLTGVAEYTPVSSLATAAPVAPAAPVLTHTAAATGLLAGTFTAVQTYINEAGETVASATATVVILAGDKITVAAVAFPANVRGRKIYLSQAANDATVKLGATDRTGAAVDLTVVGSGATPPGVSTAGALANALVELSGYIALLNVRGVDAGGNSTVAIGDRLYLDPLASPHVNKNATLGVLCGKALGAVTGGTNAIIPVLLVQA